MSPQKKKDLTFAELVSSIRQAHDLFPDFDRIVFDMVGTKIALQLEGEDARVMADNLGLIAKDDRDLARQLILNQPPHRAVVRSNHFEPYIQSDIIPFWQKK